MFLLSNGCQVAFEKQRHYFPLLTFFSVVPVRIFSETMIKKNGFILPLWCRKVLLLLVHTEGSQEKRICEDFSPIYVSCFCKWDEQNNFHQPSWLCAIAFCLEYLHTSFSIFSVKIVFSIQRKNKSSWML